MKFFSGWVNIKTALSVVGCIGFLGGANVSAELYLSEFLAQNSDGLADDDGDRSDWIEIHNPDSIPRNLSGWSLTDDPESPRKWIFPDVDIAASQYLVVFASGKDRRELGAPLHLNFRLNGGGEYLALVDPEGAIASIFEPEFPAQESNVSFGRGQARGNETVLLAVGAEARAFIPSNDDLGDRWRAVEFDDSTWLSGRTAVGYDYNQFVNLNVGAMRGTNPSVYIRVPFEWNEDVPMDRLVLRLRYEDGFVAFLNGEQIAAGNAPRTVDWNSNASADRPDAEAVGQVDIDITSAIDLLQPGMNVLAIHGLNRAVSSSDILFEPQLVGVQSGEQQAAGFLYTPTPGAANRDAVAQTLESALFSMPSGVYQDPFELTLSLPDEFPASASIYFTTDGSIPHAGSDLYEGPLSVSGTMRIRARVIDSRGSESPVASATYVQAHPELNSFSSNLPLIILENFRGGRPPQNGFQTGFMEIIERGESGRTTLYDQPAIHGRVGLKVRGSSTSGRPKPSLSIEARNENDEERGIAPLGMPRESDWVLWGPYNFDPTLMHNPFVYELSNQIGRYAPRTRFVEVFLNMSGGPLRSNDYFGVYALTEKIKRDDDRVDVEKLFPEHDRAPFVTGGYVLKIDRADPGDSGFSGAGQNIRYVYPKEVLIERPERDPQERFLRNFFRDFGRAVNGSNFRDPETGYAKYVDVPAAIDHHLLNVLAFNVDALRLSGYFHIPRSGKLTFGPVWDFDRALGSTDGRDRDPVGWRGRGGDRGTDFFNYPWWNRMFRDIDFFQAYIDRYQELRRAQFSEVHLNGIIDGMADELREAQVRNLERWNQRPRREHGGTYRGEVNHMKDWLAERLAFMDSQFVNPPEFSKSSGAVDAGTSITLQSIPGGEIFYTVDGSDPRSRGGEISPAAKRYESSIVIDQSVHVIARVRHLEHRSLTGSNNPPLSSKWSGFVEGVFSVEAQPRVGELAITEVNYHPLPPTTAEEAILGDVRSNDFEFVELRNIGSRVLDLSGVRIRGGIETQFVSDRLNTLLPGEVVVLVNNLNAFVQRYGVRELWLVEVSGALANDRDEIIVESAAGTRLAEIAYDHRVYPATDGLGFTLVRRQDLVGSESETFASRYRPSAGVGGSPGGEDAAGPTIPSIRVSEVLTNSTAPEVDAIELYNASDTDVSLDGWFITDDLANATKVGLPPGLNIPAGEYLVVREDIFGNSAAGEAGFALSSRGDEVYVVSGDADGMLSGHIDGFRFAASPSGQTQGLWVDSVGREQVVPLSDASLGAANNGPLISNVVISEIYAEPTPEGESGAGNGVEFVELVNRSDLRIALGGAEDGAPRWRLRGGVDFDFSASVILEPEGVVVIVPFDPEREPAKLAQFRERRAVPDRSQVLGPFRGRLNNAGELVRLERTDESLEFGGERVFFAVDWIDYDDQSPWEPAGEAQDSLQRLSLSQFGNDPGNWARREPTPGSHQSDQKFLITSFSLEPDRVLLQVSIQSPGEYVLEATTSVGMPEWESVQTQSVVEQGNSSITFSDKRLPTEQRYYRVVQRSSAATTGSE